MADVDYEPFLVNPGWIKSEFIANVCGPTYRLLFWSDSRVGFEHRCNRGERGTIICAPLLTTVGQPGGHQITWSMRQDGSSAPTVSPSILCPDCGTHGFIRAGRWVDA